VWISFGTPCSGIFLPVYLDGVIPAALAQTDGPDAAWPVFARLNDAVAQDPPAHTRTVREAFAPLERRIEQERRDLEAEAHEAIARNELDHADRLVSGFMARTADTALALTREIAAGL
jgi:hypothetical protein